MFLKKLIFVGLSALCVACSTAEAGESTAFTTAEGRTATIISAGEMTISDDQRQALLNQEACLSSSAGGWTRLRPEEGAFFMIAVNYGDCVFTRTINGEIHVVAFRGEKVFGTLFMVNNTETGQTISMNSKNLKLAAQEIISE